MKTVKSTNFCTNCVSADPPPNVANIFFVPKDAQYSEAYAKTFLRFFLIFSLNKILILSFWDLRDFWGVHVVLSEKCNVLKTPHYLM